MWLFIALVALCILVLLAALSFGYYLFLFTDRRQKENPSERPPKQGSDPILARLYDATLTQKHLLENSEQETLSIRSFDGLQLYGTYFPCKNPKGKTVLLFHGYRGSGVDNMCLFLPFYHDAGFDVFIPDNRAHGKSEGKYIGFGALDSRDCVFWCHELIRRFGTRPLLLHGISMGASTVITAAGQEDLPGEVCGVVSDCAFSSLSAEFLHLCRARTHLSPSILFFLTNFWCKLLAHFDMKKTSALEAIRTSHIPFLFIHGALDNFVPTAMCHELFDACPDEGKVMWIVPGAKHFVSSFVDKTGYEARLNTFFKRIGL